MAYSQRYKVIIRYGVQLRISKNKMRIRVKTRIDKFLQLYDEELIKASQMAIKATANEVIKYTLPSTPNNVDNKASASKSIGKIKQNITNLRRRIVNNIIGKKIPSGIPTKNGYIVRGSSTAPTHLPYIVKKKGKSKKYQIQPPLFTSNPQELVKYIEQNTIIDAKKTADRKRKKGSKFMWVDSPKTVREAANILGKRAGNLLSGWHILLNRIQTIKGEDSNLLNKVIPKDATVSYKGSGTLITTPDKVSIRATNNEIEAATQGYQQRVVDKNIKVNFKKHLKNYIERINTKKIKESVR